MERTSASATDSGELAIPDSRARGPVPAALWAAFGAAMLALALYLWIRWITGPLFEQVEPGPSQPPGWMKGVLVGGQILLPLIALGILYWYLIRPWRKTGKITTKGMLVVCFALTWWQEPFSNYFNHWLSYNSWLVNWGSWAQYFPGWTANGEAGHDVVVPVLITGPMYMSLFMLIAVSGAWLMDKMHRRWPGLSGWQLVGIMVIGGTVVDAISETFYFLPLGFWEYPGGLGPAFFPESYAKMPILNALIAGIFWTAMACLVYFVNDKGETIAERGIDKLKFKTPRRRTFFRFLALLGGVNAAVLTFNLPAPLIIGPHVDEWPRDAQERSYYTYICGEGTNVICPQEGLPNPRNNNALPRANANGEFKLENGDIARIVPYKEETGGPFSGPFFEW